MVLVLERKLGDAHLIRISIRMNGMKQIQEHIEHGRDIG